MVKKLFVVLLIAASTLVFLACPPDPVVTYSVTYIANSADSGIVPDAQAKTAAIVLTLSTNVGTLTRTGYTFSGWNTSADSLGTDYAEGATYSEDTDLILYAKWISIFVGTWANAAYDGNSGTPAAKLDIDNTGTSWIGYENAADTTPLAGAPATVAFTGAYGDDPTWMKFKDTAYRVLKVDGSTLYFNLDFTSYADAYATADYTYTKQ